VFVEDAKWTRLGNEDGEAVPPGTEVYDLTWTQKSGWYHRWKYFIDPITKQPRRVEAYSKPSVKSDYELKTVQLVTYATDAEFEAAVQSAFDQP
jgi:outer membrane lipoprotein-sorting protein